MALAHVTVPDCSFHWDIHHPFTPWRLLMAHFYHGSLALKRWKVIIYPLKRRINCWTFAFHLELDRTSEEREEITANRVQVCIFLNNSCIAEKDVPNVSFTSRNFFIYQFRVDAMPNVQQDQELLVVKIKLDLPGEAAENQSTVGVDPDIRWLSEDLRLLFINPVHSDLRLRSTDGVMISVHCCIINARWRNFFAVHSLYANEQVDIKISSRPLWDILNYLYSGEVRFGWPNNENAQYIAELFYVITVYNLGHLNRVFLKRNMNQLKVSQRDVITVTLNFPLVDMLVDSPQTLSFNQNTRYKFDFRIEISVATKTGPWLSYELISKSEFLVYAQVNLDLRKKMVETRGTDAHIYYQISHLHHCDYTIHPFSTEKSRNILFLGCPETFRNRADQRTEVCDSILCTLKFSDGRIVEIIQSIVLDTEQEEERERQNVLSDHLYTLMANGTDADFRILAPTENEKQPDEYCAHEAILSTRVSLWPRVFQVAQETSRVATLLLRSEAVSFVLHYIYCGRTPLVPYDLLDDIQHFAETGEFQTLIDYVRRVRGEQVSLE